MTTMRRLRRSIALAVCLCGIAASAAAQTPAVPTDVLAWTLKGASAAASSYTFSVWIDGTKAPLPATCTADAASDLQCKTPLPAMTPGKHSVRVSAILTTAGLTLESAPSDELLLSLVVVVTPTGLRLEKGGA